MLKGFKEFIARGNVVEMAVGIIIGNAFKDIVDKLVANILNPAIGAIFGKPDFTKSFILQIGDSQILFGALLTAIINFLLIAFAVYLFIIVPMNYFAKLRKKNEDDTPKEVSEEVQLLTEIRDALAKGDRA
ncbi:large conductance mechanosensitive channel protein MscL [Actinomyces sp.]